MRRLALALACLTLLCSTLSSQVKYDPKAEKDYMQWFDDAKLGIFIHWGIYAVDGVSESWSFHNERVSYKDYMDQCGRFTASKYDPADWAKLIRESGARYTVITSKHHDGVALWNTRAGNLSTVKNTPAARDLLTPFVNAARSEGLRIGIYYSLLDWSRDDYPNFTKSVTRYSIKEDPERWESFLRFNFAQIEEISSAYNPDLLWFDGDWEQSAEDWKAPQIVSLLRRRNPSIVINSRIQGYGDYSTPEIGIPISRPEDRYWELCYTMNDSWGFQHKDTNFKTPFMILRTFVDCISKGGNMLLDIGPREDGTIPDEEVEILRELGRWTSKHSEAVYGTRAGVDAKYFQGGYTSLSKDSTTLYLYIPGKPAGPVEVKGIMNDVKKARVVGNGTILKEKIYNKLSWKEAPGIMEIDIPEEALDPSITVVALDFDEGLRMF